MLSKDFAMTSYNATQAIVSARNRRLSILLSLILTICLVTLVSALSGCGTNAPTKAAQAEKIVITTVNKGVAEIVKAINAGKLTQKQCDQFNAAYTKYYDAQQVAKAVIEKLNSATPTATAADVASAQAAVNSAESALLDFINSVI